MTMTEQIKNKELELKNTFNQLKYFKAKFLKAKKTWANFESGIGSESDWKLFDKTVISDLKETATKLKMIPRAESFDLWDFE